MTNQRPLLVERLLLVVLIPSGIDLSLAQAIDSKIEKDGEQIILLAVFFFKHTLGLH